MILAEVLLLDILVLLIIELGFLLAGRALRLRHDHPLVIKT